MGDVDPLGEVAQSAERFDQKRSVATSSCSSTLAKRDALHAMGITESRAGDFAERDGDMDPLGEVAGSAAERGERARRGERGVDDGVPPAIDRASERADALVRSGDVVEYGVALEHVALAYDGSQSSPRHEIEAHDVDRPPTEARMSSGLRTLSL